jgi:hypothetical protein
VTCTRAKLRRLGSLSNLQPLLPSSRIVRCNVEGVDTVNVRIELRWLRNTNRAPQRPKGAAG